MELEVRPSALATVVAALRSAAPAYTWVPVTFVVASSAGRVLNPRVRRYALVPPARLVIVVALATRTWIDAAPETIVACVVVVPAARGAVGGGVDDLGR